MSKAEFNVNGVLVAILNQMSASAVGTYYSPTGLPMLLNTGFNLHRQQAVPRLMGSIAHHNSTQITIR